MIGRVAFHHADDPRLRARLTDHQWKALADMAACGTEACGLHREVCDACGSKRLVPNTCGNRSCPHCQGGEREAWVAARLGEVLPCTYFHGVYTIPRELSALAKVFPIILHLLMQAASDVTIRVGRDPDVLGAEVGVLMVLHTWRRDMDWHPHVHLVITAGGWDAIHQRWIAAKCYGVQKTPFFAPVDVLRAAFKQRLLQLIHNAFAGGELDSAVLTTVFPAYATTVGMRTFLADLDKKDWCIRIEPPFGGPQQLMKYLGAYINRVAISPKRVSYDAEQETVTWTYSTNAEPNTPRSRSAPAVAFLEKFAQHVLPPRFVRIRFSGIWATAHRATKLNCARAWLLAHVTDPQLAPPSIPDPAQAEDAAAPIPEAYRCPMCGRGRYRRVPGPSPRPAFTQRQVALAALRLQARSHVPAEAN